MQLSTENNLNYVKQYFEVIITQYISFIHKIKYREKRTKLKKKN